VPIREESPATGIIAAIEFIVTVYRYQKVSTKNGLPKETVLR